MGNPVTALIATLADLVWPVLCASCGQPSGEGVCPACTDDWIVAPHLTEPEPRPEGLPPCVAGGEYGGVVRDVLLAYKERGRRPLARPLGDALAAVIAHGAGGPPSAPLLLIPVPTTAAAMRARQGDHMLRLAKHAARRLHRRGWRVDLASPVRALPRPDSTLLDSGQRQAAARAAFAPHRARLAALRATAADSVVVLVDDILTTGSTLAAVARLLQVGGVPVAFAATVAATRLRNGTIVPDHRSNVMDLRDEGDVNAWKS